MFNGKLFSAKIIDESIANVNFSLTKTIFY